MWAQKLLKFVTLAQLTSFFLTNFMLPKYNVHTRQVPVSCHKYGPISNQIRLFSAKF